MSTIAQIERKIELIVISETIDALRAIAECPVRLRGQPDFSATEREILYRHIAVFLRGCKTFGGMQ